jgi:alpha-tubulin suppressor-like RCC1 family protein
MLNRVFASHLPGDSHSCALTELGAVWAWGTYRDASGVMGFAKHTRIQVGGGSAQQRCNQPEATRADAAYT